jgi:starch synthase
MKSKLKVGLLTREYPPEVYGGAGVHVEYLARELKSYLDVAVQCFGKARQQGEVQAAYQPWAALDGAAPHAAALRTLSVDLLMAAGAEGASLVHSHTWYANFAGHLAKLLYGIPHVMTAHSLEPLRPWKAEQLGGGYALSSFCERVSMESADAVVAVSSGMKNDILRCYPAVDPARVRVIHNGIDTDEYRPVSETDVLAAHGIDPSKASAVFVGRITRQKGIVHLLHAARYFNEDIQLVLCAGEPDTKELGAEFEALVAKLRSDRQNVVWIDRMLPRGDVRQLLSHAGAFVCPSVYEPFGIVNIEAMACGAAVVASRVGGIPEVVEHGKTGLLIGYSADGAGNPNDPEQFARDFAQGVNRVAGDKARAIEMGKRGRQRAIDKFSWAQIAQETFELYQSLVLDTPSVPSVQAG